MAQQWFVLKRNATLHHIVSVARSLVQILPKLIGVGFREHVCVFRAGQQAAWYYSVPGQDAVARFMLRQSLRSPAINNRVERQWRHAWLKLDHLLRKAKGDHLSTLTNQALGRLYRETVKAFELESAWGTLSDFLSSELVPQAIVKQLTPLANLGDRNELLAAATTSTRRSPYRAEQEELLRLAKLRQGGKSIDKQLRLHAHRYWYLQNDYQTSAKLDEGYFRQQIERLLKEGLDLNQERRNRRAKVVEIIRRKRLLFRYAEQQHLTALRNLLLMAEVQIALWDEKKVAMQKTFYALDALLEEAVARSGIAFADLKWVTPDEVSNILNHQQRRLTPAELAERQRCCVLRVTAKRLQVLTGQGAQSLIRRIEGTGTECERSDAIHGQTGNRGLVQGVVRVILDPKCTNQLRPGSILVTGMTTPDFVPLMRQAAAIVTDEGGITCHAAIVSRELGIPCVIATKIATKILKDGDQVEVDANHGLVRILKKH